MVEMEVKWTLRSDRHRDNNRYVLSMVARRFFEVQGRKQLFTFSYEVVNSHKVSEALPIFKENAKAFFGRIKEALSP